MVFDQFERLGTVRKVLRYLLAHDIRLGIRPHAGPNRGQLEWRAPTRDTVTDDPPPPGLRRVLLLRAEADRPAAPASRGGGGRGGSWSRPKSTWP